MGRLKFEVWTMVSNFRCCGDSEHPGFFVHVQRKLDPTNEEYLSKQCIDYPAHNLLSLLFYPIRRPICRGYRFLPKKPFVDITTTAAARYEESRCLDKSFGNVNKCKDKTESCLQMRLSPTPIGFCYVDSKVHSSHRRTSLSDEKQSG